MRAPFAPSRYVLPLILLVALVLRLVNLGERNLWYDEAFSVLFAEKGLDAMLYGTLAPVEGGAADIHPLLYYATLHGWMWLFGDNPFVVRFWSVVLGVATIAVLYLLGRDLFSRVTGLAAAVIVAFAPFHVQYSQEARMYALMALLLMLATWCLVRARRRQGLAWRWWLAFGVFSALAMYAQQLSAFYLAALAFVPVFARRRDHVLGVALGGAVALVLYLPWLAHLPAQWQKVGSYYWIPVPDITDLLLTIRSFLVVGLDLPNALGLFALGASLVLILFLGVQAALAVRRLSAGHRRGMLLVLWLFAGPILLMWLVSQMRPVYLVRGLLPSALLLYLSLAWLLTRGGLPHLIRAGYSAVLAVLFAVGLMTQYNWAQFPNSPFRQALTDLQADWQAGDLILHQNKLSALPMVYYARELEQVFIADVPGSPEDTLAPPTRDVLGIPSFTCVQEAVAGRRRVWLVLFPEVLRQSELAGRDDVRAALNWLESRYGLAERRHYGDLDVFLYEANGALAPVPCGQE